MENKFKKQIHLSTWKVWWKKWQKDILKKWEGFKFYDLTMSLLWYKNIDRKY